MAERVSLLLTILAVAWSALSISMVLAVGEGLRQGVIRVATGGNRNLIYLTAGHATQNHGNIVAGDAMKLTLDDLKLIHSLPAVTSAEATGVWQQDVRYKEHSAWQYPFAVNPSYAKLMGLQLQPGGRWLNQLDNNERRQVVVLGYKTAAILFNDASTWQLGGAVTLSIDPVGLTVTIGGNEFRVIGVLARSSTPIEDGTPVDYAAFVPFDTWRHRHKLEALGAINILPTAGINRRALATTIKTLLTRLHGASSNDSAYVRIRDNLLAQKTTRRFLVRLQSFLGIIGFITLSVAGIGIANVMFATVKRYQRDIGVRMAIGARPMDIRLHYFTQSLLTMLAGGSLGILATLGVITALHYLPLAENSLFIALGNPLPVLSPLVLLIVVLALVLVGMAAAWFPANKAAKIMPMAALQSE